MSDVHWDENGRYVNEDGVPWQWLMLEGAMPDDVLAVVPLAPSQTQGSC